MGTKNVTKTNEVQKNEPPSWAAPGLSELGRRITNIIPTMPGKPYEGNFFAPVTAREESVPGLFEQNADFTRSMGAPAAGALAASSQGPSFNPLQTRGFSDYDASGVRGVVESAMQPAFRRLQEQILPGLASSGIESGAYGGDRSLQTLPGMAIRDTMGEVGNIASQIGFQDFQQQEQNRMQAYGLATERGLGEAGTLTDRLAMFPDLLDTILRTQTGATEMDIAAAGYENQLRQREIDEQLARHDYYVRQPFQGLDVAASLLGNLATPWGTRTTTGTQTQSTGGWGQVMQGAMGLGMAAMSAPSGGFFSNLFARKPAGGAG